MINYRNLNIFDKLKEKENLSNISLVVVLIFSQLIPFSNIYFTTNDDFRNYLNIFATPISFAKAQGRFEGIYQYFVGRIPYIFDSLLWTVIIRNISHIVLISIVSYSFYKITSSKKLSFLIFILFFSWLQNYNNYNLITSYPISFELAISSIFLSFIFYTSFSLKPTISKGFFICILSFYGISCYESFAIILLLLPFFNKSKSINIRSKIKIYLPYFLSLFMYISLYILWRSFFPSNYSGNTFKFGLMDIPLFLKVAYQFTISSIPTYYFFLQKINFVNAFQLILNLNPLIIISSMITLFLSFSILQEKTEILLSTKRTFGLIITLIFITFSINSIYGFSSKYRRLVNLGTHSYVGTFFSYIFFISLISLIILKILSSINLQSKRGINLLVVFILSIVISGVSMLTGISNHYVNFQERNMTSKLQLVDQFLNSNRFKNLNENSTMLAPSLFEDFQYFLPNDWTEYVKKKTGKKINVVKSDVNNEATLMLDIQKIDNDPFDNVLTVSDVVTDSNGLLYGKNFDIYSLRAGVLNVLGTYAHSKKDNSTFMIESNGLIHKSYNINTFGLKLSPSLLKEGYYVNFQSPKSSILLSSVQINRNLGTINISDVNTIWGKGFYDLEKNKYGEWRWSQQKSSIKIINLTNSTINITLRGKFTTGYKEMSKLYIMSNLFNDIIYLNSDGVNWSKNIQLPPGNTDMEFKTDTKQVNAPGDSRLLYFSITNFTASPT